MVLKKRCHSLPGQTAGTNNGGYSAIAKHIEARLIADPDAVRGGENGTNVVRAQSLGG